MPKVKVGDRVIFFRDGREGEVLSVTNEGRWIDVLWDGTSGVAMTMAKNVIIKTDENQSEISA